MYFTKRKKRTTKCPSTFNWGGKRWYIHKREYHLAIKGIKQLTHNMNESQKLCWVKEARHKRIHSVWFHLYEILKKANWNYSVRKQTSKCQWQGKVGGLTPKEHKGNLEVMEMFILIELVVNECIHLSKHQNYRFTLLYRNARLKGYYFQNLIQYL